MIDLISKSLIWIEDVIEKDIFNNILDIIDDENISSLKKIKDKLGPSINYFQIKCVLAYISSMPDKLE